MSSLPVKRILTAYSQVAEQLRDLILSGQFKPGDRLPIEADLATSFGVSRSTVREALRELASQNLIKTSRGVQGGSYVVEPDPAALSEMLATGLGHLTGAKALSVADILEARELLEVPAARLAAQRRTQEHIEQLEKSAKISSTAIYHRSSLDGNIHFHQTILDAADNQLLSVMTTPLFRILTSRFLRDAAPQDFWSQVSHDHADIAGAIKSGDADGAAEAMREHLVCLREVYEAIDQEAPPG